ncbi:IS630 family transposase [Clostridium sp. PL3]|uniref:IS630 family transposase n=1 Tax=Clostridium thailandense TaxID=2794346 RepID=A0A949WPW2_9CLOT|nr:IS630 family transposase [Clostridium thailandense]MBV7271880.1 IS630 family transposase [Clostridium thailandense]
MSVLLDTVEDSSDSVIYAMDEAYVQLESQNRRNWSPKGISPILEKNNPHTGVNIIGASKIHGSFETFADIYPFGHSITNVEVRNFFDYILQINEGKKVYMLMDNAGTHTCSKMREYADEHKDNLVIMNLPTYSPNLNPQENLWNLLKNAIFTNRARASVEELFDDICNIYGKLNENTSIERSVTCARNYYG